MPITIDEVRKLKEGATPGPWNKVYGTEYEQHSKEQWIVNRGIQILCALNREQDAAFIAALPDIADLAIAQDEELTRLRNQVEILQGAYETACEQRNAQIEIIEKMKDNIELRMDHALDEGDTRKAKLMAEIGVAFDSILAKLETLSEK